MREGCGCGAYIQSTPRQVAIWRTDHKHDNEPEPEKNGSEAYTERDMQFDYDNGPFFSASIGFQPNH